ncbi:unnamed protein product [Gulo gulo]|uniref:Uncharacterized protein n=1 Tax=Gulo gulo TaxID=48420 RepID=A0A9X9PUV6_GULGU|nr:unnamed protein product [Gulo gulo]
MAKRTKVRIISKYGTHYGSSLRKMVKKIESACQAHLLLLWLNQDEETSCGDLALWFLHENGSWRYPDPQQPLLLSQ